MPYRWMTVFICENDIAITTYICLYPRHCNPIYQPCNRPIEGKEFHLFCDSIINNCRLIPVIITRFAWFPEY